MSLQRYERANHVVPAASAACPGCDNSKKRPGIEGGKSGAVKVFGNLGFDVEQR